MAESATERPADPATGGAPAAEPAAPPTATGLVVGVLRTARPRQWIKNVLVVAAPAAAGELLSRHAAVGLTIVFVLFTTAASAVYLINDARDAEADRAHPEKCHRPVAAGQVPVALAYTVGGTLAVLAPLAAYLFCTPMTAVLLAGYVVMQLAYCVSLKHVLVVDLVVVTTGFLMRAMIGGVALDIPLSRWFLITAGFGSLFMVSAKRYSEAVMVASAEPEEAGATRALLSQYTVGYLRFVWQLAAGVAVLAYCLWALEGGATPGAGGDSGGLLAWRQLSMVPFILAVLRYAVFADRAAAGAPEDVLLKDRALALIGLAWVVLFGLAVIDW
ncbi:decaprenyl-phosphate phosphoribosyltransferase [Streptomyces tsukubensis]|uniref:Decaprenyl-phosphate phosphoribosyltransferase n=1 Tax=Streptomyces tsukubensis TaxID=83656 RepID=A0A1V4A443_9ACTN|nr:decaprenyl-phosphate phosphoribosyltransferase [Streptomyces tsukubensis]OON74400.1 decaprenyl-phosphate phosphoribosyltransferase [Streptomyces tsukubensis]QFR95360.1 decaprenyl-phosphate phosphoribosyltransferase [Streptomyces tsukubensis]